MGNFKDLLPNLNGLSVSRRSFMKGTAALGAMAALYGCSKDDAPVYYSGGGKRVRRG